jgi:hypothetical protein
MHILQTRTGGRLYLKVIERTQSRLVLGAWPIVAWLFCLIFLASSVGLLVFFSNQIDLVCQRVQADETNCSIVTRGLLGNSEYTLPGSELQSARVDQDTSSDGSTYQVVLVTDSGEYPLSHIYSSGYTEKARFTEQVNAFIKNPKLIQLDTTLDERSLSRLGATICLFFFLAMALFFGDVVTYTLDKNAGTFTKTSIGLRGYHQFQLPIAKISRATVESSGSTYRVSLVETDGTNTPLTAYYSSGYKPKENDANQIAEFLQIPGPTWFPTL